MQIHQALFSLLQFLIDCYKKLNYETKIVMPGYLTNYDPKLVYPFAEKIENIILESDNTLMHVFSGGLYPTSIALDYIILNQNQNKIAGMIWESSPVECSVCSAANALRIHLQDAGICIPNTIATLLIYMYNKKTSLAMETWCNNFYRTIESQAVTDIPKIAINGTSDTIIPEPELFFKKHPNIPLHTFQDAKHNKAILSDPLRYEQILKTFINMIN